MALTFKNILIIILIVILGGAFITFFATNFIIKPSEAYKISMNLIYTNQLIKEKLGEIEKVGFTIFGGQEFAEGELSGNALFEFYIKGNKGKGYLRLKMTKEFGTWKINKALFVKENEKIFIINSE